MQRGQQQKSLAQPLQTWLIQPNYAGQPWLILGNVLHWPSTNLVRPAFPRFIPPNILPILHPLHQRQLYLPTLLRHRCTYPVSWAPARAVCPFHHPSLTNRHQQLHAIITFLTPLSPCCWFHLKPATLAFTRRKVPAMTSTIYRSATSPFSAQALTAETISSVQTRSSCAHTLGVYTHQHPKYPLTMGQISFMFEAPDLPVFPGRYLITRPRQQSRSCTPHAFRHMLF
jgi:hypothetical protein